MVLDFLNCAANLKKVPRQGWIDKLSCDKPESVAEHCFSMSVMAMLISDLEGCSFEKTLKMVLLHDLAESETGDYTPGQIDRDEKIKLEDDALARITGDLPDPIRSQYLKIWQEYVENRSPEARLVHQIDKLEMALQAKAYERDGHSPGKLKPFFDSADGEITDPRLRELLRRITESR